ncbi:hypothetical protein [Nostoc sp.]
MATSHDLSSLAQRLVSGSVMSLQLLTPPKCYQDVFITRRRLKPAKQSHS